MPALPPDKIHVPQPRPLPRGVSAHRAGKGLTMEDVPQLKKQVRHMMEEELRNIITILPYRHM